MFGQSWGRASSFQLERWKIRCAVGASVAVEAPQISNRAVHMSRETPAHRKIADQLRQRIAAGRYESAGLPPELQLMEEFDVSRHTIRAALQRLVADGLIERRAGLGTRVTNRGKGSGFWSIGTLNDLLGEFSVDQFLTLSAELIPAQRFPGVATLFGVRKRGELFHMLRILTIDGLPYAVAHLFTAPEYGTSVPKGELGSQHLINLVAAYSAVRPARARQMASATAADEEAARQLGVAPGAPLLIIHRTYFDSDDRPLVHAELLCRPDRYQQVVDFVHEGSPSGEPKAAAREPELSRAKAIA
jgi:GntR family transcriptional regulator